MKSDRRRVAGLLLALLTAVDLGLVAVLTGLQFSLITVRWTAQQWVFAVILPSTALVTQATGGLALWWWWFNRTRTGGRYQPRHSWEARRWVARTSMVGEPQAVAVRIR